ncbi:tetratricopeptide repeat protein [Sulfurimonas sp.]
MYKILLSFLFLLTVFSGCTGSLQPKDTKNHNKKIFEQEDTLIMFALRAEEVRDNESASKIFDSLYEQSGRKEYLYRSMQNSLILGENEKIIKKVDEITQNTFNDYALIRLKILALIQSDKLKEAQLLAINLVQKSKEVDDYILVSDIYVQQEKFDMALKYLEGAYKQNYNEKILDKMSIVLYVNLNKRKDAIAYLETHTRVHGCSVMICKRLIAFYSNDNNIDGLLSAYLRYYKIDTNPEISKKIVQLYGYKREYLKLIGFLEESGSDDKVLLQLYINSKNYIKAYPLAQKLYEETGEIDFLGQSAIYEYESQTDKNDKEFFKKISTKFENVIEQYNSTLYLNYYGYILIDHDIDVKKGLSYINRALKQEPNSSYYLDSLAWGYYKLGKCKKALSTIKKVLTLEGGDDPEVLKHYETIKNCKQNKKVKK